MENILHALRIQEENLGASCGSFINTRGTILESISPINNKTIAKIKQANIEDYQIVRDKSIETFDRWRLLPAPKRGEIIRQIGDALRKNKEPLGQLVSFEMGKILSEGLGEIQEMIDIADFSVGISRQLYGLTIPSERPLHAMRETWHPLGCIGIISAFNFPLAVWSWNAFIAAVCGNTMIWKPSPKTPLVAIAVQKIIDEILEKNGFSGVMGLVIGPKETVGEMMINDTNLPLISATGSCAMGKHISTTVAKRFGKTILELGGNNALIVMEDADLDLALRAVLFGAIGTTGQRCTTTRRLFLHRTIKDTFIKRLINAYKQINIGDPLDPSTKMGPLIDYSALINMQEALQKIETQGGKLLYGGTPLDDSNSIKKCYVNPALIEAKPDMPIIRQETFAPILYIMEFENLEEAIALQNNVPQGLSSAIFTNSVRSAEHFLSVIGSDCGIANVNIGTSGAEIGGAFGGEKETGGGREAGSDSWKSYMRRQTQTINWSKELPLAQGISFG